MSDEKNYPVIPTVEDLAETGGVIMGDPEAGDPFVEMSEGMRPMPEETDRDKLIAAYDLIGRTGAQNFVVGYDDEKPADSMWFAQCEAHNAISRVDGYALPCEAAERLARKLTNGGRCTSCNRVTALVNPIMVGVPFTVCAWVREGKQWIRGCVDTHEEFAATKQAFDG